MPLNMTQIQDLLTPLQREQEDLRVVPPEEIPPPPEEGTPSPAATVSPAEGEG